MPDTELPKNEYSDYRRINVRVSEYEYGIFVKAKNELKLSARAVIEQVSQSCATCTQSDIIIFDKKKKKSITIKSGFLCKRRLNS